MNSDTHSWAVGGPVTSPFARPAGVLGRLAGRFMLWTNKQDDVLDLLDVQPGDAVLEIGYGPGALVRLLSARTGAAQIRGVDPSPEMRRAASRTNRAAVREGRVVLGLGTAAETGEAGGSADRVVCVNNVALWPDLEAGVREVHRVLRPGGQAVIAWHGGSAPGRIARSLCLPEEQLERIEEALRGLFSAVERRQLRSLVAFTAVR
ncbi:methyltransferase domain-containing protein [Streptomyces bathyalis]|uniref:Methyltransferase domain-containing protein n=1 Tax=Streptomyces bathyalis TaxID=2710756 RepID=A0A7T1TCB0_9ACTN|nr:class I SAM-dependent methyltransferase [Streptomyces bathyalis]QPP10279.1 methyltransferase domain-containing protein [Streptomyces bathyalis]